MFLFQVFRPERQVSFAQQVQSVARQLTEWMQQRGLTTKQMLFSRVFLSDAANQWAAVQESPLFAEILSQGAVSYIEQPNVDGAKISLLVWFASTADLEKEVSQGQMQVRIGSDRLFLHTVRLTAAETKGLSACAQTELAFERHCAWLREQGLTLRDNCFRTWIYVRDIDRHYAGVVEGRNRVFEREGLTRDSHYIASTGIGGYTDNREAIVAIDFLSGELAAPDVRYLQALDYLNPTYEYGVAFERGTALSVAGHRLALISGTASIDKFGQCLHRGDVLTQSGRLLLNIEKLLNDDGATLHDLVHIIVYLRDMADYPAVRDYFHLRFPGLPTSIVMGRVCRPEWLIEVEGIAVTPLPTGGNK